VSGLWKSFPVPSQQMMMFFGIMPLPVASAKRYRYFTASMPILLGLAFDRFFCAGGSYCLG
jgi:hypothetical protein